MLKRRQTSFWFEVARKNFNFVHVEKADEELPENLLNPAAQWITMAGQNRQHRPKSRYCNSTRFENVSGIVPDITDPSLPVANLFESLSASRLDYSTR